ncbi:MULTISPECIES: hypothetical protein [unclassified Pseudomonas]|uniref:hypothetical protein n=1 Tax=unclassified Pseudomonas TaxID=196821 RepID=UPI001CBCEC66|nr:MULTISPECIES: hypothetical protein [unclassified Pseudomonas]
MAGLLEIVFEDVGKDLVLPLLETIISDSEAIVGAECSEGFPVWSNGNIQLDFIRAAIEFDAAVSIFVNVENLRFTDMSVKSALVRIVKYEDTFDLDISFYENDVGLFSADMVGDLFAYSKEINKQFKLVNCYFGMEPASDETTRFFTNKVLGPLK